MVQSQFRKGSYMYQNNSYPRQSRVAIGGSGRLRSSELILQGRARRLGIGMMPPMYAPNCNTSSGVPQNCQPPVNVCPENQKRFTMPFTPGTGSAALVTAGATAVFIGSPQALFKPDRLIIPSTIGPYFDVLSFTIANKPQTMGAGAVPADIYSEVSTYTEMSFDQAYPGVQITLTVQNKSSVSQTFQAALIGWSIG